MMQPGMPTGYQGSNPNNVVHPFVQQGKIASIWCNVKVHTINLVEKYRHWNASSINNALTCIIKSNHIEIFIYHQKYHYIFIPRISYFIPRISCLYFIPRVSYLYFIYLFNNFPFFIFILFIAFALDKWVGSINLEWILTAFSWI